jgi:hypothetical protein
MCPLLLAQDPIPFFFRNNGQNGVHLAARGDGSQWRVLN